MGQPHIPFGQLILYACEIICASDGAKINRRRVSLFQSFPFSLAGQTF